MWQAACDKAKVWYWRQSYYLGKSNVHIYLLCCYKRQSMWGREVWGKGWQVERRDGRGGTLSPDTYRFRRIYLVKWLTLVPLPVSKSWKWVECQLHDGEPNHQKSSLRKVTQEGLSARNQDREADLITKKAKSYRVVTRVPYIQHVVAPRQW